VQAVSTPASTTNLDEEQDLGADCSSDESLKRTAGNGRPLRAHKRRPRRAHSDVCIGETGDGRASGITRRVPRNHVGDDVPNGPRATRVEAKGTPTLPDSLQRERGHRATGAGWWSGPADDAGTKPPSQRESDWNSATKVAGSGDRPLTGRERIVCKVFWIL
jgi:hypothetical protein